jgi:hypothetical protein
MVQFDENAVRQRMQSLNINLMDIELSMDGLANLHQDLQTAFDGWLQGDELEFEFEGITLKTIKERTGLGYFNALFMMSSMIKSPELVEKFRSVPPEMFQRQCGGFGSSESE